MSKHKSLKQLEKDSRARMEAKAEALPDDIKKAIEEEVRRAIDLDDPRARTPCYIVRNLEGKADIVGLSTYAANTLKQQIRDRWVPLSQ